MKEHSILPLQILLLTIFINKGCLREGRKLGLLGNKGYNKGNIDVKEQAQSSCEGINYEDDQFGCSYKIVPNTQLPRQTNVFLILLQLENEIVVI